MAKKRYDNAQCRMQRTKTLTSDKREEEKLFKALFTAFVEMHVHWTVNITWIGLLERYVEYSVFLFWNFHDFVKHQLKQLTRHRNACLSLNIDSTVSERQRNSQQKTKRSEKRKNFNRNWKQRHYSHIDKIEDFFFLFFILSVPGKVIRSWKTMCEKTNSFRREEKWHEVMLEWKWMRSLDLTECSSRLSTRRRCSENEIEKKKIGIQDWLRR